MRAFMHWVNEYDESIQTRVALFLCLTYKLFGRYSDFFVFFLSTKLEQIYPFWFLPNIRGLIRCEKELFVFWTQNHYKLRGMNSQIWTDIFFFTQIQSFSNLEWINAVDRWCDLSEFCLLYKSHQNLQFVFSPSEITDLWFAMKSLLCCCWWQQSISALSYISYQSNDTIYICIG